MYRDVPKISIKQPFTSSKVEIKITHRRRPFLVQQEKRFFIIIIFLHLNLKNTELIVDYFIFFNVTWLQLLFVRILLSNHVSVYLDCPLSHWLLCINMKKWIHSSYEKVMPSKNMRAKHGYGREQKWTPRIFSEKIFQKMLRVAQGLWFWQHTFKTTSLHARGKKP